MNVSQALEIKCECVCRQVHSALPPAVSLQPAVGRPEKGCEGGPDGERGPAGA